MSMTAEEIKRLDDLEAKFDQLIKLAEAKTAEVAPATTNATTTKQESNTEEIPGWFMAYLATQSQANTQPAPAATEEDKKEDRKKNTKEKATKIMAGVGIGLTTLLALGKVYSLGQGSGYDARNKELLSLPDRNKNALDAEYTNELDLTV